MHRMAAAGIHGVQPAIIFFFQFNFDLTRFLPDV